MQFQYTAQSIPATMTLMMSLSSGKVKKPNYIFITRLWHKGHTLKHAHIHLSFPHMYSSSPASLTVQPSAFLTWLVKQPLKNSCHMQCYTLWVLKMRSAQSLSGSFWTTNMRCLVVLDKRQAILLPLSFSPEVDLAKYGSEQPQNSMSGVLRNSSQMRQFTSLVYINLLDHY